MAETVIEDHPDYQIIRNESQAGLTLETRNKPGSHGANADTLRDRAEKALATNKTYLSLQNPSAAQNAAQVKALTREATALIRLLLNRFEDTE